MENKIKTDSIFLYEITYLIYRASVHIVHWAGKVVFFNINFGYETRIT